MAKNNVSIISYETLDQMLSEAKTQEDLFGVGDVIKNLSKTVLRA